VISCYNGQHSRNL